MDLEPTLRRGGYPLGHISTVVQSAGGIRKGDPVQLYRFGATPLQLQEMASGEVAGCGVMTLVNHIVSEKASPFLRFRRPAALSSGWL